MIQRQAYDAVAFARFIPLAARFAILAAGIQLCGNLFPRLCLLFEVAVNG